MKLIGLRALLALALLGTFGLRAAAPTAAQGCGAAGHAHHPGAHDPGHGGGDDHGRSHGGPLPRCECPAQSCTAAVIPAGRVTLASPTIAAVTTRKPAAAPVRRLASEHLLPFAHGPPAPHAPLA
jgi:hypothetical protein